MLHHKLSLSALVAFSFISLYPTTSEAVDPSTSGLPHFFDSQERLNHPNLGTLQRLRFLTTVDFPPFNFIDKTGRLSGYNIDLLRAICMELKLEQVCEVEAVPWNELISHMNEHGGEAIIAGMNETPETAKSLIFTQSYLRFPARFVSSGNIALTEPVEKDLKKYKIGIVSKSAHEALFAAYFPEAKWQPFENDESLRAALKAKNIDLAFGDGMAFSQWLNDRQSENCCQFVGGAYIAPQFLQSGLRIAVSKDNPQLVEALNYALKSLERKGKLTELYLRYFPISFY
ncbi:transporter substrate-binding domain-containing protein [Bartonella apis]|uniref:transporter substrate-binding domain-containing protein n=1 Tax=Bartonella apis TaxID=1686310 RepID=UPI00095A85EB|nr:transporter substrate-binding domain-containing protein [Bartonella apis]OLY48496.1 polar amino acid transport system substrate-binding protein [Bartonella apis]